MRAGVAAAQSRGRGPCDSPKGRCACCGWPGPKRPGVRCCTSPLIQAVVRCPDGRNRRTAPEQDAHQSKMTAWNAIMSWTGPCTISIIRMEAGSGFPQFRYTTRPAPTCPSPVDCSHPISSSPTMLGGCSSPCEAGTRSPSWMFRDSGSAAPGDPHGDRLCRRLAPPLPGRGGRPKGRPRPRRPARRSLRRMALRRQPEVHQGERVHA